MKRFLVAYCTNAGSTTDVASVVGEELGKGGAQVDLCSTRDVSDLHRYAAVVVGGPMIFGAWHPEAVDFITRQQRALSQVPVAFFITALHLTQTAATHLDGIPVYQDPALVTPPQRPERLSFIERQMTIERYLTPVLQKAPLVKPLSVGFFAGKLDYHTLTLPKRLFARIVVRKPGDFRNWPAIRAWAAAMRPLLLLQQPVESSDVSPAETVLA